MFRSSPGHLYLAKCLCTQRLQTFSSSQGRYHSKIHDTKNTRNATRIAAYILGGALVSRLAYNRLLIDTQDKGIISFGGVRRDASKATVLLNTAGVEMKHMPKFTPELLNANTKQLQKVDAAEFSKFCAQQRQILQMARERSRNDANEQFRRELTEAFRDSSGRIDSFASWYFSYSTTWQLLSVALTSAARYAITFRSEQTLSQKVSDDVQRLVCRKYEAIVLRPALTDPKIHRALYRSIQSAHKDYLTSLEELETSVAQFVSRETRAYKSPPRPNDVIVDVDWKAQLQKVDHLPLTFEKAPEFSVALVGASTVTGKLIGGGAAAGATKAMIGKLVSPFVTKAVGITLGGGATAVAATGGAAAAGPIGAAAGAAVGLGVDMTVNAGVAMMQRSSFVNDVQESLNASILEWNENLFPELERIHGIWFDHADTLLDTNMNHKKSDET